MGIRYQLMDIRTGVVRECYENAKKMHDESKRNFASAKRALIKTILQNGYWHDPTELHRYEDEIIEEIVVVVSDESEDNLRVELWDESDSRIAVTDDGYLHRVKLDGTQDDFFFEEEDGVFRGNKSGLRLHGFVWIKDYFFNNKENKENENK